MLWGKSSRCVMVTKGWFKVSIGVILLSASMVSIFFNRSMNSRRSAFSTNRSLPSKSVVMFTWGQTGTGYQNPALPPVPTSLRPFRGLHPHLCRPCPVSRRLRGSCCRHCYGLLLPTDCGRVLCRKGGRWPCVGEGAGHCLC